MNKILTVFVVVVCIVVWYLFQRAYRTFLHTYFVQEDTIVYDFFMKHFIQVVSEGNYFMNYGLWEEGCTTLADANRRLVEFLFEKTGLHRGTHQRLLDVGCGYGVQDTVWAQAMDASNHLTAIDISPTHIDYAKKTHSSFSNITYQLGDAVQLHHSFSRGEFDGVLNVESAFHYKDRATFFQSVCSVLKEDGVFVISDIVLSDNDKPSLLTRMFLRIFSDFLHIPEINLITAEEWKQLLADAGLRVVEYIDITEKTFEPYYQHFFQVFMEKKGLPSWMAKGLLSLFLTVQPFSYVVAVCRAPCSTSTIDSVADTELLDKKN